MRDVVKRRIGRENEKKKKKEREGERKREREKKRDRNDVIKEDGWEVAKLF